MFLEPFEFEATKKNIPQAGVAAIRIAAPWFLSCTTRCKFTSLVPLLYLSWTTLVQLLYLPCTTFVPLFVPLLYLACSTSCTTLLVQVVQLLYLSCTTFVPLLYNYCTSLVCTTLVQLVVLVQFSSTEPSHRSFLCSDNDSLSGVRRQNNQLL